MSDSSAQSAESSTPETGKSKANTPRNANSNEQYKIPRVVPGQGKGSMNQKTASLQTQGSQLQPPLLNSNNPSHPSNRSRGRGNHHQSRNNTNQHHGNSRFFVCNSQNARALEGFMRALTSVQVAGCQLRIIPRVEDTYQSAGGEGP